MRVTDKTRKDLHSMLDAMLDDDADESPDYAGVLILREEITRDQHDEIRHELTARGIVGKHSMALRYIMAQLKES